MKIEDLIKKYKIELTIIDGKEMLKVFGKPTAKQGEEIRTKKPEIIVEIKRQKEETQKRWEEENRIREIKYQAEKREYLKNTDLRRCLVKYIDEWYNVEWSIKTLAFTPADDGETIAYLPQYHLSEYKELKSDESLEVYTEGKKGTEHGFGGMAWEINPEEESKIIAEQEPIKRALREAKRIKAEEEKYARIIRGRD